MLTLIRKRFTYTNIALTLALVFAMTGGAYAANKYLITSTKQISPKVLKSLVGKSGKNGTNGAAGPVGPQGPAGPAGTAGKEGSAGKEGLAGTPGKEGSPGKEGEKGEEGSPWTAGGTLPPGKTETGAWSFGYESGATLFLFAPISFTIPLATPLDASHVHFINENGQEVTTEGGSETPSAECLGTVSAPTAEPGNLCVYTGEVESAFSWNGDIRSLTGFAKPGTSTAGAQLLFGSIVRESYGHGSWAVTAEE